ncbi:hypothetical protein HanOQP8_Chr05g0182021 [Helianthus annuus]|nr:hypothetical protein HanOQP8_Chr05g0182021 [Helianthus annuus]
MRLERRPKSFFQSELTFKNQYLLQTHQTYHHQTDLNADCQIHPNGLLDQNHWNGLNQNPQIHFDG